MDSGMSSEELERIKDRMKVNFFQVEKRLAEDDIRMDKLEKELNDVKGKAPAEKGGKFQLFGGGAKAAPSEDITPQIKAIDEAVKNLSSEFSALKEDFQKAKQGNSDQEVLELATAFRNLQSELFQAKEDIRKLGSGVSQANAAAPAGENFQPKILALDASIKSLQSEILGLKGGLEEIRISRVKEDMRKLSPGQADASSAPVENLQPKILALDDSVKILQSDISNIKGTLQKIQSSGISSSPAPLKGDPFADIKGDVRNFLNQLPDLEERFELVRKDLGEIEAMRAALSNDRELYRELRTAVLASIEKLGGLEKEFTKSLEEMGKLSRSVEETRQKNEKILAQARDELRIFEQGFSSIKNDMRGEMRDEVTRLEAEAARIEGLISSSDNAMKEEIIDELVQMDEKAKRLEIYTNDSVNSIRREVGKMFEEMRAEESIHIGARLDEQSKRIGEFGMQVNDTVAQFGKVKRDIVEKTIDNEMNKLLIILSDKMKGLVNQDQFDLIRADIRKQLEKVRSPEIKPMEDRIACLEEDIAEMKVLVRGVSQRLPVIMD